MKTVKWHATNLEEKKQIESIFGQNAQIFIANNISDTPRENIQKKHKKSYVDLFFLARVAPMKNLAFALGILSKTAIRVKFSIYGPIDDFSYWHECQEAMRKMPQNVHVEYFGALNHQEIYKAISRHDFLFLPTRGENFGHSIAECLANGTPVIISDKTPWLGLKEKGIGWDIPLDKEDDYTSVIEEVSLLSESDYSQMSNCSIAYYKSVFTQQQAALKSAYFNLFSN